VGVCPAAAGRTSVFGLPTIDEAGPAAEVFDSDGETNLIMIRRGHKTGETMGEAPGTMFLAVCLLCLAASATASAQIKSAVGPVALQATLPSSITVTATPALVNFALLPSGISNGSSAVSVTTTWSLGQNGLRLTLYAYFTTSTAALADAFGHKIPSANVSASVNGGGYAAFTGASPFAANSSITIFSRGVPGHQVTQSRTDTLNLRINTTGLGLVNGTYTGLLVLQAQAI
jgi:hypothetical protein